MINNIIIIACSILSLGAIFISIRTIIDTNKMVKEMREKDD